MPEFAEKQKALDFAEARKIVIKTVRGLASPPGKETLSLDRVHGRILAEPVLADRHYPALRRSLRDGFAVRSGDLPGVLRVRGEVRAGQFEQPPLTPGEALEIMTGAPVPNGADAVVMIEHVTRLSSEQVRIDRTADPDQFIIERGDEAVMGAVLIAEGTRLDASHVGVLAMIGHTSVTVSAPPSVAILATGDEIVSASEMPAPHQIRNSNSHMLAALVNASGGHATILPVARDTKDDLRPLLEQGLAHDMLLVSGGVSAGRYDLVKPTLRELDVEFHFERVRVQPGQPTAFGTFGHKPVFGLPGNPGSSLITYQLFARPALEILAGLAEPILPLLSARFEVPFRHKPGLTRFLPARLCTDGNHLRHIAWHGSSDLPALARANAFLVADHDREVWDVGDEIRVMLKP
ncbi:MAG: molybdopterin molybdotransferase MoeA [Acidobacteriaceae bacterium]|nr:molybdopterin molybdotransferase MoeA [Acidobacteriaceae bacterium]